MSTVYLLHLCEPGQLESQDRFPGKTPEQLS